MTRSRAPRPRFRLLPMSALLAALSLVIAGAAGCSTRASTAELSSPVVPARPDLATPRSAVRSYLDWVSFSYRMADSGLSSSTMDPYESVRVDAYIELNRQKNRGIEQRLVSFAVRSESREGTAVLVASKEEWRYRYFTLDGKRYDGASHTASYDATYTVVRQQQGWVVQKVDATPLTPVE